MKANEIRKILKTSSRENRYWFFEKLCIVIKGKPPVSLDHWDMADIFALATDDDLEKTFRTIG